MSVDHAFDGVKAEAALETLDAAWYREVAKRGRWMDLIGDYAGNERFVLDGDALLQHVLDDPLLALGRESDPSFQILHALHSMERLLGELLKRAAVFDVVVWKDSRHLTLKTGSPALVSTSRSLARNLVLNHLFHHATKMNVAVHVFQSLSDPAWHAYRLATRPMFVMTNDGGTVQTKTPLEAERIIAQRAFIFGLLTSGIAVTLLHGSEFRDSKIFAFVLEQRFDVDAARKLSGVIQKPLEASFRALQTADSQRRSVAGISVPDAPLASGIPIDAVLTELVKLLLTGHDQDSTLELTYLFALHCLLVTTLSVDERARLLDDLHPDLMNILLAKFLPKVYIALESLTSGPGAIVDFDGRVFVSLVRFVIAHSDTSLASLLDPDMFSRMEQVWSSAHAPPIHLSKLASQYPNPAESVALSTDTDTKSITLLPFHNPVFESELASVHVRVADSATDLEITAPEFSQGTTFSDTKHWHNHKRTILPKHLGGEEPKPATARLRQRKLRNEQFFMASLQRLANSLTGTVGIPSTPKAILSVKVTSGRLSTRVAEKPDHTGQSKKKPKAKPISNAEKYKQQNLKDKKSKDENKFQVWWHDRLAEMAKMESNDKRANHLAFLQDSDRSSRSNDQAWLTLEMDLYNINLQLLRWIAEPERDSSTIRDRYTVDIIRVTKNLYDRDDLTPTALAILESVFIALGFSGHIPSLSSSAVERAKIEDDRPLTFDFVKLIRSKTKKPVKDFEFMHVTEDPVAWQLRLFGEHMDRSMDSSPDSRVSFNPDAWQREVLDCLDQKDCSVLVVAPTSAGKTFISFYAMEQILRDSDDDILVYVAPTKALVNQVAAEVYARFKKDVPGRTCWAIHTRDYRVHDPQKCQILVTVPEMLAIMLLSPPLANTWTPRIKRIILDEIHSIGQHEGGAVWEQIILLAPCPIIGLSATIGEAERFNTWLEHVQQAKGFRHRYIHYPHRYSHLRKFAYFPQMTNSKLSSSSDSDLDIESLDFSDPTKAQTMSAKFAGLTEYRSKALMRFIHPVSALSFGASSLPSDFSLEATDLLCLYQALRSCGPGVVENLERLEPSTFFPSSIFLKQKDILRYEAAMKEVLSSLLVTSDMASISSPLRKIVAQVQDPILAKSDESILNTAPRLPLFLGGLVPLLADLHATNNLPALLFNFDRNMCENMAAEVLRTLTESEKAWRKNSPEWQRKIDRWEEWKILQQERARHPTVVRKKDAEDMIRTEDHSWESTFDPRDPSPQFTFTGLSRSYGKRELTEDVEDLSWRAHLPGWAIPALRRGVGVHHAGMNKNYRNLVERLFRIGFLRVVIATGTLALGINAPTKTSVFCGDSPFLTALMYRQCSGRAGRRGFDLLGRVVFYGLPLDRIQRLMLSRLPGLAGSFPMSSTLSLRLFSLLHGSDNSPYAVEAIKSILRLPQISFGSDIGQDQLLHHLRFSIEYLRRANLLDQDGRPINLFGIASHLYYTEPSNLATVALLQSGVIHDICTQPVSDKAQLDFLIVACHLFGRRYLPEVYTTHQNIRELIGKGPSRVVLPPIPGTVRKVLVEHHEEIVKIFTAYAVTFASQYASTLPSDDTLPLSEKSFGRRHESQETPVITFFKETAIRPIARSPFIANSGHADNFHSVRELANTVRRGIHLNESAVPSLDRIIAVPGDATKPFALNAHILDFYLHGQVDALVRYNGIRRGDVWYILQDFHMSLAAIRGDLENLLENASRQRVSAVSEDGGDEIDSGYGTLDPAEAEEKQDVQNSAIHVFQRPAGTSDRDWKVYEVVNTVTEEFNAKFKMMWA